MPLIPKGGQALSPMQRRQRKIGAEPQGCGTTRSSELPIRLLSEADAVVVWIVGK